MRKILYILGVVCFSFDAVADDVVATSELNFGKFVQVGTASQIKMSTSSQRTIESGAIASTSPVVHSGTIENYNYGKVGYDTGNTGTITLNEGYSQTYGFCLATISNIKFSTTTIKTSDNTPISVGAQLNISRYCKEGVYTGDIEITYQLTIDDVSDNRLVHIPFSFEIEEPLSVTKADNGDMDFGMYITPSATSTVTLSSGGVSTTGNIVRVGSKTPHCANLVATGVGSRTVQMTFDAPSMYLYLNGDSTTANNPKLQVTYFTVNDEDVSGSGTYSFKLPEQANASATKNLAVGATLTVPANTAAGQYTGSIGVTFIYNDYIISNQ